MQERRALQERNNDAITSLHNNMTHEKEREKKYIFLLLRSFETLIGKKTDIESIRFFLA